jgi:hypothetical protein
MGRLLKAAVLRVQEELLQRILAKAQSKKLWHKVSWGSLQKRTNPSFCVIRRHKFANIGPSGKEIQGNLPKNMFKPSLELKLLKVVPLFGTKGENSTTRGLRSSLMNRLYKELPRARDDPSPFVIWIDLRNVDIYGSFGNHDFKNKYDSSFSFFKNK